MAKPPKSDDEAPREDADAQPDAPSESDDIEDAKVIEETGPEKDEAGEGSSESDAGSKTETETSGEEAEGEDEQVDPEAATPWAAADPSKDEDAGEETAGDDVPDETPTADTTHDEPAEETKPVPAVAAASTTTGRSRGGAAFGGMVLGGIVAGVIGFGVAQYFVPGSWPFGQAEEDPLAADVLANSQDLAELQAQTEAQAQAISQLEGDTSAQEIGDALRADVDRLDTRMTELSDRLASFDQRITALEKMPQGDSAEAAETAAAAYERELADMRAMLESELETLRAEQEEAQSLQENAAESAREATARAALSRIMAALDSGQPFADALSDLTSAMDAEVPEALASQAEDGVPTLASLRDSFPPMAREALDAALRAMVDAGEIGRGEAFLRTQLGTRSLEPQEGDDPDAILSRAEFALTNGRIAEALEELSAMPEAAQPVMQDWIARAESRLAALEAGAALGDTLNP
ncbi:MAG: hypothetical protein ACU0CY_14605 [Maritimibacter harenae]